MARRRYLRSYKQTPGSESAGYHYGATPKNPAPTKTPVVAPPPSEAATTPAGDYAGAGQDFHSAVRSLPSAARSVTEQAIRRYKASPASQQLSDLITPGPTAHETAEAASRLGVKPQEATQGLAGGIGAAAASLVHAASQGSTEISQDVAELPKQRVHSVLGRKTLGTPTLGQVFNAEIHGSAQPAKPRQSKNGEEILSSTPTRKRRGGVGVNKAGELTVPATRRASRNLTAAQQAYAKTARPDASGLSPAERAILPYAIRAHKQYPDIPISVLMAQDKQESGFNPLAESSAGAFGTSQFIPSTAASYGVQRGNSPSAIQSQLSGQAHLLHDDNFASDPQGALSDYSGGYAAGDYNNPILVDAQQNYSGLDRPTNPNPKAQAALKAAKAQAERLGIPTNAGPNAGGGQQPQVDYLAAFGKVVGHTLNVVTKSPGYNDDTSTSAITIRGPQGGTLIRSVQGSSGVASVINKNKDPEIAARLLLLSAKTGKTIYVTSGYRTPAQSESVGGFPDDPHTKGEAMDIGVNGSTIESANSISEAEYNSVGLYRPFGTAHGGSSAEDNHVQLLNEGTPATGGSTTSTGGVGVSGTTGAVGGAVPAGGSTGGTTAPKQRTGAAPLYTAAPNASPLLAVPSLNPSESSLSGLSPEEVNDLVSSILKRKKL